MNPIHVLKADVKTELVAAGINTYDYIPERVNPPVAIVAAGEPFIEAGETFAESIIRLDIRLVAGTASNIKSIAQLEDLIFKAVTALGIEAMESVSQPFPVEVNGALYLAADLKVAVHREMKEVI